MTNTNCFQDCFKCNRDDDHKEHSFKLKKGLKCITSEKRKAMNKGNHILPTQGSVITEKNRFEEIKLKEHVASKSTGKNPREFSSQDSPAQTGLRLSFQPNSVRQAPQSFIIQHSVRTNNSLQTRQRRYSLDSTPKPQFAYRPTTSRVVKAKLKQLGRIQKQHERYDTETEDVVIVQEPTMPYQYGISIINEESEEKEKSSSLFQGAKSIVSRMISSRKRDEINSNSKYEHFYAKEEKNGNRLFNDAKVCESQNTIIYTHTSFVSDSEKRNQTNELSQDSIPVSPHTKNISYSNFRTGRLLGVGKWAHVYLCQQKQSNSIYAIKEIFKSSFKMSCSISRFNQEMKQLVNLNHSNLMNIHAKFETADKLCLLMEYCNHNLFEELREKGLFPMEKTKKYAGDLVNAIVYLQENQRTHGSVNIFQVFINFNQCKLKHSLTQCNPKQRSDTVKDDIQGLAIVIFQMGHGIIPFMLKTQTLYEKQKMYKDKETRKKIIEYVNNRIALNETDENYRYLNQFVKMLFNWEKGCRLISSTCLNHPFLTGKDSS